MSTLPPVPSLAQAIATSEGYGQPDAIPTLANNPGDLELGDIGYGTASASGGNQITIFGSVEDGWNALINQLDKIVTGTSSNYSPNTTLSQFGQTYAGSPTYGSQLATMLGVSPNTPISQVYSPSGSTPSTTSSGLGGTILNSIGLNNLQSNIDSAVSNWVFSSRLIMLIIGIILIAAGLFSFKTTQTVIESAGKIGALTT